MTKKECDEVVQIYKDQISLLKQQLEDLRETNSKLQEQNFRMQDGMLAIRSPEAYADLRMDRAEKPEVDEEALNKARIHAEVNAQYLNNLEKPLFSSVEDLEKMLSSALWTENASTGKSLHGNNES